MEFDETEIITCYFYNDRHNAFTENLFYGREWTLLAFELLLFGVVDYHHTNFTLAAVVTYIVSRILAYLRLTISRSNLAKKTLVDKRFLL